MFVVREWEGALENFRLEEEEEPFDLKVFLFFVLWVPSQKKTRSAKLHLFFSTEKFTRLFLFKKVKPLRITKIN